jgi:hypothetical protein
MIFRRFFKNIRGSESGQVLVIFAIGSVAFLGMLGLVVDAGNLYFERRHAQATADSAALVAAQNAQGMIPNVSLRTVDAVKDARIYAIKNGYDTDPAAANGIWKDDVRVDTPPISGPYTGNVACVEVQIHRSVPTLFAGIFGATPEVSARAVARGKQMSLQVATLSLYQGNSSTENAGSTVITVVGGTYSRGETKAQTGDLSVVGRAYSKGGFIGTAITPSEGFVGSPYSAPPPDLFDPKWPAPTANSGPGTSWSAGDPAHDYDGSKDANGWIHITPGTYKNISVASSYKVIFEPGVYRVTNNQGVGINGEVHGNGVCFVMDSAASFDIQSQAKVYFASSSIYNNILVWSANSGTDAVKVAGGADIGLWGTIYAPYGMCRLAGNTQGLVHGQVVADKIQFSGGSGSAVVYDKDRCAEVPGPGLVE